MKTFSEFFQKQIAEKLTHKVWLKEEESPIFKIYNFVAKTYQLNEKLGQCFEVHDNDKQIENKNLYKIHFSCQKKIKRRE